MWIWEFRAQVQVQSSSTFSKDPSSNSIYFFPADTIIHGQHHDRYPYRDTRRGQLVIPQPHYHIGVYGRIKQWSFYMSGARSATVFYLQVLHIHPKLPVFTQRRFWPSCVVVACVCMSACPCVCLCVWLTLTFNVKFKLKIEIALCPVRPPDWIHNH